MGFCPLQQVIHPIFTNLGEHCCTMQYKGCPNEVGDLCSTSDLHSLFVQGAGHAHSLKSFVFGARVRYIVLWMSKQMVDAASKSAQVRLHSTRVFQPRTLYQPFLDGAHCCLHNTWPPCACLGMDCFIASKAGDFIRAAMACSFVW
jgi:hypothetical protein